MTGQEQQVHFDRVFRASRETGIAPAEVVNFLHVYFGFYVDSKNGKKLSSRDSVANVTQLLDDARAYFRGRVGERAQGDADVESAARELAIGSLVFNDLKQDIKGPVEIDTADLAATIAGFEKSGAAYVVYAACRARSILRRAGVEPTPAAEIERFTLNEQEVGAAAEAAAAARQGRRRGARLESFRPGAPPPRDRDGLQFLLHGRAGDRGRHRRSRTPADHVGRLPGAGGRPAALPRHLPRGDLRAEASPCDDTYAKGDTPPRD